MVEGQGFPLFRSRIAPAYRPVFAFIVVSLIACLGTEGLALTDRVAERSPDQNWVDALHHSSGTSEGFKGSGPEAHAWMAIPSGMNESPPPERIIAFEPHTTMSTQPSHRTAVTHLFETQSVVIGDVYTDDDRVLYGQNVSILLDQVSQLVTYDESGRVELESFCDDRGSGAYSMVLAEERGRQTAIFLRSLGIEAHRIKGISYGQEQPPCMDQTVACWEDNRRAHKAFQVLALKESKSGCLVRVRVMSDADTMRHIRTSPASAFLKKMHLAEPIRRTATVTRRPMSQ